VTWEVYFHSGGVNERDARFFPELGVRQRAVVDRVRVGRYPGQPFVLDERGRPDALVNKFFAWRGFRGYASGTRKKYALSVGLWLNFCGTRELRWGDARPDDVADFKFWRMTDKGNPARVGGSTMHGDVAAISALYGWASARHGIADPVLRGELSGSGQAKSSSGLRRRPGKAGPAAVEPAGIRDRDVKWLDPAAVRRWVDVGMRGFDLDGREPETSRNRTGTRDAAFAGLLYGSGLRVAEAASLLDLELPDDADPGRAYFTCQLAAACAKGGGHSRRWWLPRSALSEVLTYAEGPRADAVARAQHAGRYERLARIRVIEGAAGSARRLALSSAGGTETAAVDGLSPESRRCLFRRTGRGLEPAALWLNENGMPRSAHAWQGTFQTANERIARAGLPSSFRCTPHMLRHSCALRWYSVGRLIWDRRLAHLTEAEQLDFRAQFGDTWQLVQTILGHAHPQTTVNTYLEPFKSLEVELLLECAAGLPLSDLMREIFKNDSRILHDPVAQ
jgi:integrase